MRIFDNLFGSKRENLDSSSVDMGEVDYVESGYNFDVVGESFQRVLLALDKKPTRETATPKVVVQEDDSELVQNQEYLIFRGIVAKNPNGSDSDILTEWMAVLGKQRVTDKLSEKFWEYWEEAKRTL